MKRILSALHKLSLSKYYFWLLAIIVICPFIIIAFFNHPSGDDYNYAAFSLDKDFWFVQTSYYNWVTGRYIATAILSTLNPLVLNSFLLYKIIPIVLIIGLYFSIQNLIKTIFNTFKPNEVHTISISILTLYFIQMPSLSQGIYWFAGAITYQLGNILTLILFAFNIKLIRSETKSEKAKHLFLCVLFSFFTIGCNETNMLIIFVLLILALTVLYLKTKKVNYPLVLLFGFVFLFAAFVILAPGNAIRSESFKNKHQISSLFKATLAVGYYVIHWLPILLIFTILFYNYLVKIKITSNPLFAVNPFYAFIISIGLMYVCVFPSTWMGGMPEDRVLNVAYLFFIFSFLYFILTLGAFLKKQNIDFLNMSPFVRYMVCVVLLISLFSAPKTSANVRQVYFDLFSGSAHRYNKELSARYIILKTDTHDAEFDLPELENKPGTIYYNYYASDSKWWLKGHYYKYWNKKQF